jgi:putative endonuclease
MTPAQRGRAGEARAAAYLSANGYEILRKNFRTPRGEVDIVAVREETLVFVEVKSWKTMGTGELGYAISPHKRSRIRQVAAAFRNQNPAFRGFRVRFDVLFLRSQPAEVVHLTDVF